MANEIIRISQTATRATHRDVCVIDHALISQKAADSRKNARGREIHVFHQNDGESLQRMLNALQPGTYIQPHRHSTKVETLILIQGALGFLTFEDDGTIDSSRLVFLSPQNGNIGIDCRAGYWHTFVAWAPDTVVLEVKSGPYDATDKEVAWWAPAEISSDGPSYLAALEDRFRDCFDVA